MFFKRLVEIYWLVLALASPMALSWLGIALLGVLLARLPQGKVLP